MSVSGRLLLGLSCVLMASRSTASENGLDTNFCNRTLNLIPPNLPSNITKLTLSHNLIEMSEEDIRTLTNYTKLTELYLDNNKINILPGHVFDSLSNLRILSLSDNSISRVEPKAFKGLGQLKELDLSHNPLQSLPSGVFASLTSLESLFLQDSDLQSLENNTFTYLIKLRLIDLGANPWNCTCDFLHQIRNSGIENIGPGAACASPKDREGKSLLDSSFCFPKLTTTKPSLTIKVSSTQALKTLTPGRKNSANSMDRAGPVPSGDAPPKGNTWKFLVGVLTTALGTSTLLVCAVKAPSWYKLFFNYRHQRLREEEPNVFTTGRFSDFSLDTEQTDISIQEVEMEFEDQDEDGYIEDGYIEAGDYKVVDDGYDQRITSIELNPGDSHDLHL